MIASQVVNQEGRKGGMQETTRRPAIEFLLSFLPAFLNYFLDQLRPSLQRCWGGSIRTQRSKESANGSLCAFA